ncbi:MAG: hypothetical protein K2X27_17080 [Candidatus Obscuribacterales bacterium]|nr:hypothetical protein [Candidatus Obscuribacterales bacterium]
MNTELQKMPNFIARIFLSLRQFTGAFAEEKSSAELSLATLNALSLDGRLLLADCLERCNPELTLLEDDKDASEFISAAWLLFVPCSTIGIVCFQFKPRIWRKLADLRSGFLTEEILSELKRYRKRKSALYPWVWCASH